MARSPSEWTLNDWSLVAHALLRTRWQDDLDDQHALELCRELGETKGVAVSPHLMQTESTTTEPPRIRPTRLVLACGQLSSDSASRSELSWFR